MIKNALLLLSFFFLCFNLSAQSILGKWKTIDENTGQAKSIVEIFENDGKIYGKILSVVNPAKQDAKCIDCDGDKKNKPLVGLVFIEDLSKNGDVYEGGTILNPENGKVYRCKLTLNDPDTLQVRGYLAFFYRTQYWKRVK
ncbi:uncharacterized protein (DUF2147 family) [Winogradskyella epiphytica]|uniref:Uncharacterized protein (DUF2147 family) n=1 Tax=Winogradskyella epiphytica TaxID=262005 RepID=A0A2V4XSS9_9FLAO|nr:DUF2147 domain-containing protein [Winogradskyella epiphytica]PYE81141.1 uncharacterized protein (DUF2147 family) [Winogradskyella epiphytica]GGW67118.1 hypothetical protein GCM10008085_18830 [Winogradskyella epiphytica]